MGDGKPISREVAQRDRAGRLKIGVTHGYLEDLLYRAHVGSDKELCYKLIPEAELRVQHERTKAIQELRARLVGRISVEGHGVVDVGTIDEEIKTWQEDEVLGIRRVEHLSD